MANLKNELLRWVVKVATYLSVPFDKLLHFICAMAISAACVIVSTPIVAVVCTSVVSIAKEIYDCHKPNPTGWDWHDLLADFYGMLVPLVLYSLSTIL